MALHTLVSFNGKRVRLITAALSSTLIPMVVVHVARTSAQNFVMASRVTYLAGQAIYFVLVAAVLLYVTAEFKIVLEIRRIERKMAQVGLDLIQDTLARFKKQVDGAGETPKEPWQDYP